MLAKVVGRPVVERDSDHRTLQEAATLEEVERLERHLLRKIAADAEDHQGIGKCGPVVLRLGRQFASWDARFWSNVRGSRSVTKSGSRTSKKRSAT